MTKAESTWMDAITQLGCICCRLDGHGYVPAAVHHILSGGRRIDHLHTIPLCDPGHHQNGEISRHPFKRRFEARYGSEQSLLDLTRTLLAGNSTSAR